VPPRPTITVSFPASPEYLRLARLATADVASRAGFDYEEIDDLRIGVSELCSMISGAEDATVTLEFSFDDQAVLVQGVADPGALVENELSRAIVGAVVDDYEVVVDNGAARFRLSKRAHPK
jgi:serine/threonine-protein kinase RsbW